MKEFSAARTGESSTRDTQTSSARPSVRARACQRVKDLGFRVRLMWSGCSPRVPSDRVRAPAAELGDS